MTQIDPHTLTDNQLPQDLATRQAIFEGHILVMQDDTTGQLMACDGDDDFSSRSYPLEYARFVTINKYPQFVDVRGLPTEEDKRRSPGLYCDNARRAGGNLLPGIVAKALAHILASNEYARPAFSEALNAMIKKLQQASKEYYLLLDRRYEDLFLDLLPAIIVENLPEEVEEIRALPEKEREFFYRLRFFLRQLRVLLSWYRAPKLYIIKYTSPDSSVGEQYSIVSSNQHRALVSLAASYTYDRAYGVWKRFGLFENDTLIRSVRRGETHEDLNALVAEWDRRTDEEIDTWLI